jgi:hypothetical protein
MFFELLIVVAILLIIGWLSYYISKRIFLFVQKKSSRFARPIQIVTGIMIFGFLCCLGLFLFFINFELGR